MATASSSPGLRTFYELDGDSPRAEQPEGVFAEGVKLMPHQLTLLHKCREMEARSHVFASHDVSVSSRMGLIGDKSGAGKTLVLMALCCPASPRPARRTDVTVSAMGDVVICSRPPPSRTPGRRVRTNVVVVPHGLVHQWEEALREGLVPPREGEREDRRAVRWRVFSRACHIREFTKEISARVSASSDDDDEEHEGGRRVREARAVADALDEIDIVVVTADHWEKYLGWLMSDSGVSVRRFVVDEADTSTLSSSSVSGLVRYEFCWFVTASVRNVVADAVNGGVGRGGGGETGFVRKMWRSLVADVPSTGSYAFRIIRMTVAKNADAYVDACLGLPPPAVTVLEDYYVGRRRRRREDDAARTTPPMEPAAVLRLLVDGTVDPDSARERVTDRTVGCNVCFEPPTSDKKVVMRCCSQVFCVPCISRWLTTTTTTTPSATPRPPRPLRQPQPPCPVCKTPVRRSVDTLLLLRDDDDDTASPWSSGSEAAATVNGHDDDDGDPLSALLLRHDDEDGRRGKKRVLVFVEDAKEEREVMDTALRCGHKAATLRGNGDRIGSVVRSYRSTSRRDDTFDAIDVLILTRTSHGAGLNLQDTTDVMIPLSVEDGVRRRVLGCVQRRSGGGVEAAPLLRLWYLRRRAART